MDAETRALGMLLSMTADPQGAVARIGDEGRKSAVAGVVDQTGRPGGRARASALLEISISVIKEDM